MPKKAAPVAPAPEEVTETVDTGLAEVAADQQFAAANLEAENLPPNPEVEQAAEPVEDKAIEIIDPEQARIDAFRDELLARRDKVVPVYTPPPRSERQMTQTELEFEAGRKANERHAAQQAFRPVPKREPGESTTVPVFRPADHVPNMQQGHLGARNLRG